MFKTNEPVHILRYGTNAEQKHIESLENAFDILSINGNMLAYTPASISKFLLTHCIEANKHFFIDPITHAFQHSLDKIMSYSEKEKKFVIKKSIKNLIDFYGEPIKSKIESGKVVIPSDFDNNFIKKEYCSRILDFQENTIKNQLNERGYLEYMDDDALLASLKPAFVIPPYFYLSYTSYDSWLELNIEFIKLALEMRSADEIYAEIVITKELIQEKSIIKKICEKYSESGVRNILLWIDDFKEHECSPSALEAYIEIIKYFNEKNIKIYNLYGSYFSIMLCKYYNDLGFKLNGVGHGLEYGESRAVVPVGGGIPTSKYYYYPLHKRVDYKIASELLGRLGYFDKDISYYYNEICGCKECKTILEDDLKNFYKYENTEFYEVVLRGVKQKRPYASQQTKEICLKHYQFCKHREFKDCIRNGLKVHLNELDNIYNIYISSGVLSYDSISYLKIWTILLRKYLKDDSQ